MKHPGNKFDNFYTWCQTETFVKQNFDDYFT